MPGLRTSIKKLANDWHNGFNAAVMFAGLSGEGFEAEGLAEAAADTTANSAIWDAANSIEEWLGEGYTKVEGETSDLILRSADGTKQIRFDLTNSHGLDPHVNVETWQLRKPFPRRW